MALRRFKPSDIEQLAKSLAANQNAPRNASAAARAPELPKGELAALVFERLEQRHSLAEIVIALRVSPDEVRDLYHTWLVGLWSGELQRSEPALPPRLSDRDASRRVTREQLAQLLAALPEKQPTRISVARVVGEYVLPDGTDENNLIEYSNLAELGGFVVCGRSDLSEITCRFGAGEYRVSAYALDARAECAGRSSASLDEENRALRVR